MKPTQPLAELKREIAALQKKLAALGLMHPGSVSRQYQVCGKPGCRCMDPKEPQRHGPYHKLAYVHRGKPVSRFVRADCVADLIPRLAVYKTFRTLINRWIELSIRHGVADFFSRAPAPKARKPTQPSASRPGKRQKSHS